MARSRKQGSNEPTDEQARDAFERAFSESSGKVPMGSALFRRNVERAAARGAHWAEAMIERVARAGWAAEFRRKGKVWGDTVLVATPGGTRRMYGRAANEILAADGTPTGSYQLEMFITMKFDEIRRLYDAELKRIVRLQTNTAGYARALELEAQCPQASTPAEALEILGLDAEAYFAAEQ